MTDTPASLIDIFAAAVQRTRDEAVAVEKFMENGPFEDRFAAFGERLVSVSDETRNVIKDIDRDFEEREPDKVRFFTIHARDYAALSRHGDKIERLRSEYAGILKDWGALKAEMEQSIAGDAGRLSNFLDKGIAELPERYARMARDFRERRNAPS